MGKSSSAKQDVTQYSMSIHLGVALALDSITRITVDEKVAWQGTVSANTTLNINKPSLFGGERKEGGLIGAVDVLMGRDDQVLPALVAARYGKTPETCPAFRGLTTLFFRGNGQVASGLSNVWQFLTGPWTTVSGQAGFIWKMNSPVIAQKIDVTGVRAPKGLNPDFAMIGPDANPIHMIYECLVNDEWGMGGVAELIDKDGSFEPAAEVVFNESFGLSILWMRQTEIEKFVSEILDHIQATLYVDPNTGLLSIKLLRDDYDIEDLPVITPDNAKLTNYRIRSPGEVVNEITGTWTNPANEQEESITLQDIASINSQGDKVAGQRNYYGIRNAELLKEVLTRDLRASTAPLASADVALDRSLWNVLPGQVALLAWPERNIDSIVVRFGKVNYGKPGDSAIKASVLQDVFSLARPPIPLPVETEWEDPSAAPAPLTMQLTTLPSFFVRNGELNRTGPVALGDGEVLVASLAESANTDSLDYGLVSETLDAAGEAVVTPKGNLTLTPLGYLADTLSIAAESELPADMFPDVNEAPTPGGFVFIGYGDLDQEVALVTARTDTGWTIARGVLDTTPRTWPASTPVWVVNPGSRIVDEQTVHAAGDTVTYRGLDRTTQGELAYEDADDVSLTLTERPHLPLRPANVTVGGVAFGEYDVTGDTEFAVAWSTRNRLLEDTQVLLWTDGPVAPEYRQETIVSVYDSETDELIAEYPYLWTETSLTFQKTDFDRYATIRFELWSRRDDLESLCRHRITATGFAADAGAAAPPATPTRTPPPAPYAAPAVDSWTAEAGTILTSDGTQRPGIRVSGQQDNPDATDVVVRTKPAALPTWTLQPAIPLDQEPVSFDITGLWPETLYDIEVAYLINGVVGLFLPLSDVTTGPQIASDTTNVGGRPAADILEALDNAEGAIVDVEDAVTAADARIDVTRAALRAARERLHAEAARGKISVLSETQTRAAALAVEIARIDALLVRMEDAEGGIEAAEALIATLETVTIDLENPSSLASQIALLSAALDTVEGDLSADITTIQTTLTEQADDLSDLAGDVEILDDGLIEAQGDIADAETSLVALAGRADLIEADIDTLGDGVADNAAEIGSVSQAVALETAVGTYQAQWAAARSARGHVAALAEVLIRITETAAVYTELDAVELGLAGDLTALEGTVAGHTTLIADLDTNKVEVSDFNLVAARVDDAEDDLDTVEAAVSTHATALADLEDQVAIGAYEIVAAASGGLPAILRLLSMTGGGGYAALIAPIVAVMNDVDGEAIAALVAEDGDIKVANSLFVGPNNEIAIIPSYPALVIKLGAARMAFGKLPNDSMIYWFGPSQTPENMTKANATEWKDSLGRSYARLEPAAGTLEGEAYSTSITVPDSVTLDPIESNGNPITVQWSYAWARHTTKTSAIPSGTTGTCSATIKLYRTIEGGSEALMDTQVVTGEFHHISDTSSSHDLQQSQSGSWTYEDTDGGADARTWRVEVASRSIITMTGPGTATVNSETANFGARASE